MQFVIIKELSNRPYYWDGQRFTSYAPNQITFASRSEAEAAIASHGAMSFAFIRELD
jgi:hypothetical protein